MAVTLPETVGASVLADLFGVDRKTIQRWGNDGIAVKARRNGFYVLKDTIRNVYGQRAGADSRAAKRKAESEQERRDLDNEIREENLRKIRDEVIDFKIVEIWKKTYAATIAKQHIAVRPRLKRLCPGIADDHLDAFEAELAEIRESCISVNLDLPEELMGD